jgi:hypothetical protein
MILVWTGLGPSAKVLTMPMRSMDDTAVELGLESRGVRGIRSRSQGTGWTSERGLSGEGNFFDI